MLEIKNLSKTFGDQQVLDHISFLAHKGEILGLIGQNGSGKTTLFRLITSLLIPDEGGTIQWEGEDMGDHIYQQLGYLPEQRGLYENMTIEDQLMFLSQLKHLSKDEINKKIDLWLDRFHVKGDRQTRISNLSKGNQQKIQLISCLIHQPQLVILDEPFSGLDSVNASYLKEAIVELKEKGACIIFSSHNLLQVEELCDAVLMIHQGKQVFHQPLDQLKQIYGKKHLTIDAPHLSRADLTAMEGVQEVEGGPRYTLTLEDEAYGPVLFKSLTADYCPTYFSLQAPPLKEIFAQKVGELNG